MNAVHGLEYSFGSHKYSFSGMFKVKPRSCPGYTFRRSILLGSTEMTRAEFHSFMDCISRKYGGDTYHLTTRNCNHFSDEVCMQLTGKPIPAWVNRLARIGRWKYISFATRNFSLSNISSLQHLIVGYDV